MVYQLDGEAPAAIVGDTEAGREATTPMVLSINPEVVPVMVPQKIAIPKSGGSVRGKSVSPALA
ncbi:hypothetical protein ABWH91_02580 [Phycisphaerales bacterium ac7]